MKEKTTSRRDFLRKGLLAAAVASAVPITTQATPSGETVKMLTPDGKLVEVNKSVVAAAAKKKANNTDILEWRSQKG